MAIPRIFVSSTCYDLQEIRFQLRHFIKEYNYEPVMSEFDDIFYNYESHVQDSCLEEIKKCQLFTLVIGNNYGSIYHQEKDSSQIPDSVTLKEFKEALEVEIYKHIFINKYVDYDYQNYKRALNKKFLVHFQEKNIPDNEVGAEKRKIKLEFDKTYPFPYDSYSYVFHFLDIIHEIKDGSSNAYNTFESFADIKDSLKKQWAGFMYESLTKKKKRDTNEFKILNDSIKHIDSNIKKLLESKVQSKDTLMSFDVSELSKSVDLNKLLDLQQKVSRILDSIFCSEFYNIDNDEYEYVPIVWFNVQPTDAKVAAWLKYITDIVNDYKWSKSIQITTVFKSMNISRYLRDHSEINYEDVLELSSIYNSIPEEEKSNFVKTVVQRFVNAFEKPEVPEDDDVPF